MSSSILNLLKPLGIGFEEARFNAIKNNKEDIADDAKNIWNDFKENNDNKGILKYGTLGMGASLIESAWDNKEEIAETTGNVLSDMGSGIKDWYMESTIAGRLLNKVLGDG